MDDGTAFCYILALSGKSVYGNTMENYRWDSLMISKGDELKN